jgi:OHCU decarboxylase
MRMRLPDLNALREDAAAQAFLRCCGSSRWARAMAAARPFASLESLHRAADTQWSMLQPPDVLEAFAAHPKIGETAADAAAGTERWSADEQSGARSATDELRQRLAAANRAYESRFGYIFIICASGKTAEEMLASLESRLWHTPEEELAIAAAEQRQITRLRLGKLLDAPHTT